MSLRGPLGRSRWTFVILVSEPVLLWVVQRVNHFRDEFVLLRDLEHGSCVLVSTAVICG